MQKQSFLQAEQKEWMKLWFHQEQHNVERNKKNYSSVETGKSSISEMSEFTKMISKSESLSCPSLQSSSLYYLLYFQIFWTKQWATLEELPRGTKSKCKRTLWLSAVPTDLALPCPYWPASSGVIQGGIVLDVVSSVFFPEYMNYGKESKKPVVSLQPNIETNCVTGLTNMSDSLSENKIAFFFFLAVL